MSGNRSNIFFFRLIIVGNALVCEHLAKPEIVLKVTFISLVSVRGPSGFLDLPCWRGGQIARIYRGRVFEVLRY